MRRKLLKPTTILSALVVLEAVALIAIIGVQRWRATGVSAAERGRQVAEHLGCFACHGPGGTQGIANPGSDETEVPAWSGGTVMMYVQSEKDIREWILYGKPRGHEHGGHEHGEHEDHEAADKSDHAHPSGPSDQSDRSAPGHDAPLLEMPAYEGRLTEQELSYLVAYYKAVAGFPMPADGKAAAGMALAAEHGCFGCHGPGGRGSVSNPGSLKGYIPGWDGADYRELVKSDAEMREWVLNGISARFAENPAAKAFTDRAPLKMPKYRGVLNDQQIGQLGAYIHYLQRGA